MKRGSLLFASMAVLSILACGESEPRDRPGPGPEVISFGASKSEIAAGESTVLSWTTTGATKVELFGGDLPVDTEEAWGAEGLVEIWPAADTTYELVASDALGAKATAAVVVKVRPAGEPRILSFAAEPDAIGPGEATTLRWATADAEAVQILTSGGGEPLLVEPAALEGSVSVTVSETTTFTLEARRGEAKVTADVTVRMATAPVVEFSAASETVDFGDSTSLIWSAPGATKVVLAAEGITLFEDVLETGSHEVSPERFTSYTLVASNDWGSTTVSAVVAVRPLVISFTSSGVGLMVGIGDLLTLSWQTAGAERVVVTNLAGFDYEVPAADRAAGSIVAPVAENGSFRISATLEGVVVTQTTEVLLAPAPSIDHFLAEPAIVTATTGQVGRTTLTWSTHDADRVSIVAIPGGELDLSGTTPMFGSVDVSISTNTRFELTAGSKTLERTATIDVRAVEPAAITALEAQPLRVGAGESFLLSWTTTGAEAIRLEQDGSPIAIEPSELAGQYTAQIAADATFTLFAANEAGDEVERSIDIHVGAPIVSHFDADRTEVDPGETVQLSWENIGGVSLVVTGPGGAIPGCATTDLSTIESGGCSFVVAAIGDRLDLEMAVENGIGQVRRATVAIEINLDARIVSFTTQSAAVSSGDPIVLAWDVTTDSLGQPTTLTLEDDLGVTWPLAGLDPLHDSLTVTASTAGTRTFTLAATSLDGAVVTATVDVEVHALPTLDLVALSGDYDPGAGAPFQLSWTTTDATSLSVHELDEEGEPVLPAIFEADPVELAAGTGVLELEPTALTTWQAVATNALGRRVVAAASVQFVPLDLVWFEADPLEIIAGDSVTLDWWAVGASGVSITNVPQGYIVGGPTEPFIDLSQSLTALEAPYGDPCNSSYIDEGCPLIDFPDDFSFNFEGADRVQARVYVNGFLSFDLARTGQSYVIDELPSSYDSYVHVAPFWADLDPNVNGRILYETGQDADGTYLVFQWSHYDFASYGSDLNFEVVLRENGDFDFRYQGMTSPNPDYALGGDASIGYQNLDGTVGESLTFYDPIPGLQNSGYSFRLPRLDGIGTVELFPDATTTYDLIAHGYDGTEEPASVTVVVHQPPAVSASVSARVIDEGEILTIEWQTAHASELTILEGGNPIHVAAPADVAAGSVSFAAVGLGPHTFTIQATGALGRQASQDLTVDVLTPFGLDSFEVDDPEIAAGGLTTLSWITHGAEDFELTENGIPGDTTGLDFNADSIAVSPVNTTVYALTVSRSDGRSSTMTRTVRVIRASLDSATVSATRIPAGGSVDVTWSASGPAGDPVGVQVIPSDMAEVPFSVAYFEDISSTGTELTGFANQDSQAQTIQFPPSFSFPFFGKEQHMVRVSTDGFLSFRTSQVSVNENQRLPDATNTGVNLAPFWDDLHPYAAGRVHTELVSDSQGDRFIVQWSNFDFWSSGGATGADLNFQVVLFPDGTFDYRYGMMVAPTQDDADGLGATIGYQAPGARFGQTISFDEALVGGLSDRSWRFEAFGPVDGTVSVSPGRDGAIRICAVTEFDFDCQTIVVEVVGPGVLVISEVQLDPSGGPGEQWFELRNLSQQSITLDGMEIHSGAESHVIAPLTPIVIQPGAYATLAAGASPGFVPDYVYGADIEFDPLGGDLAIHYSGMSITSMEWDQSWTVIPGVSLLLDGAALMPATVLAPLVDSWMWCESVESYTATDFGTPGTSGSGCLMDDYDVDYLGPSSFIDISTTGTPLPLTFSGEEVEVLGGLPFHFPYFAASPRTELWVGSSGYVGFAGYCFIFGCGMDWDEGMILAFDDWDMELQAGSAVYHQTTTIGGRQVTIVQWSGMGLWGLTGSLTFQVQLWEGGDIVIAFGEIQGDDPAFYGEYAGVGLVTLWWDELFLFTDGEANLYEGLTLRYHYR